MNKLQDLSNLINIRQYLAMTVDNIGIKLSRDELKSIQQKIPQLDRMIIDAALKTDLTAQPKVQVSEKSFTATRNIDTIKNVMALDDEDYDDESATDKDV